MFLFNIRRLRVILKLLNEVTFRWDVRVEQIDCSKGHALQAPDGCRQYFTEVSGRSASLAKYIIDLESNAPRLFLIHRDSRVVQFRGHVDALPDLPRLRRVHQEERRVLRCVGEHVHGGRRRRPQRQLRRPNAVLRRGLLPGDGHRHILQRRLHRRSRRQHCAA